MLATILLACIAPPAHAQEPKLTPKEISRLEKQVASFMSANSAPGISVAVVRGGKFVWEKGFGMADLENSVPVTPPALFALASVSKPITATGVMLLWERGKLDLDAPIQKYCPAFPVKKWPITSRELLGHLSGIRHYRSETEDDLEVNNAIHFNTIVDSLRFFANDELLSQPGAEFHYSTYGYTVLGCVMEGASGEKYTDFMRKNILAKANMPQTQPNDVRVVIPHRARGYEKGKSGVIRNAGFIDSSYKIPGGGLLSSASDVAHFEEAILNDALLKRATRDAMWTPQKTTKGVANGYALGWGTGHSLGFYSVGHSGGEQGTSTAIMLAPDVSDGVVVLCNLEDVEASDLAEELLKIVVGSKATASAH